MTDEEKENKVIRFLIGELVERGLEVSLHDGEERAVEPTTDAEVIMKELRATGMENLCVHRKGKERPFGYFLLIYGNGFDVIADASGSVDGLDDKTQERIRQWEEEE